MPLLKKFRRPALLGLLPVMALLVALLVWGLARSTPPVSADDNCQTFQETSFKVCGRFLDYWRSHGGLTQQGLPISDVFSEKNAAPPAGDGQTHRVQYFQRARFEEHPENKPPYDVLLGLLGTEQYTARYATPPAAPGSPTPIPVPTPPATPGQPVGPACLGGTSGITGTVAQACVSNSTPAKNINVILYARLVSGGNGVASALMDATWHFQGGDQVCSGTPGTDGLVSCSLNIGNAPSGVPVKIDVRFRYNGADVTTSTTFTPQ